MSFIISDALAQGADSESGSPLEFMLPLLLMFGIFYFLLIRPQQKKAKEHKTMLEALKKGDEVITNGGLLGKISDIDENYLTCKIAENVEVKIQSHAITHILPKGTIKNL